MGMTLGRWHEVMTVFEAALERAPGARAQFLDQVCGPDAALRHELETLLAADAAAEGFLEPPVANAVELLEGDPGRRSGRRKRRPSAVLEERLQSVLGTAYRFERELGGGGMSRVFLATESACSRRVVLKLLPPELTTTVDVARFRREVSLAARLHHPHLVPLLTAGEIEGDLLYYTMPYVEGESLRERLRRETILPVHEALGIAREVANALSYAHSQGVIHRDIKPENILLSGEHAVVTDFGIARAIEAGAEVKLTQSGYTLGTPAYMSPQQMAGEPVDGRADVYSLGCVLYEMLAGRPPYAGAALLAVLTQRLAAIPQPLRTLREGLPESVEQAVTKALARLPVDRFQTAAGFADALAIGAAGVTPRKALHNSTGS